MSKTPTTRLWWFAKVPTLLGTLFWAHAVHAEPEYRDCSDAQIQTLRGAFTQLGFQFAMIFSDLQRVASGTGTDNFRYWFGEPTADRVAIVRTMYQGMYNLMDDINFQCGCTEPDTFAWVAPTDPEHIIHLCDHDYFGTDKEPAPFYEVQMGALLHELSHFTGAQHVVPMCGLEKYGDRKDDWPFLVHTIVEDPNTEGLSPISAESYRLYGLNWQPDEASTVRCGNHNNG
jgi:hypothetical protein